MTMARTFTASAEGTAWQAHACAADTPAEAASAADLTEHFSIWSYIASAGQDAVTVYAANAADETVLPPNDPLWDEAEAALHHIWGAMNLVSLEEDEAQFEAMRRIDVERYKDLYGDVGRRE